MELTDKERSEVDGMVRWIGDGVILIKEVPQPSLATVEYEFDAVERLTEGVAHFAILVDLTSTARPSAEIRQALRARIRRQSERITHVAMYTGTFLIAVAAKFVFGDMGVSTSTHKRREDALEAIRRSHESIRAA